MASSVKLLRLAIYLVLMQFVAGRDIMFRKLSMCPGSKKLPLQFDHVSFRRNEKGVTTHINFDLTVKKQVNKLTIIVTLWKCDLSGNPDSCEYFLKDYNSTSICEIMGRQNQLWTSFMEHFTMPNECPIKVGKYSLKDGPLNDNQLRYLPIPTAYWKVYLVGYDEDSTYLSCVDVEFEISNRHSFL